MNEQPIQLRAVSVRMIPDMMLDSKFLIHLGAALPLCMLALTLSGCAGDNADSTSVPATLETTEIIGESGTQLGQFVYPRGMDIYHSIATGQVQAVIVDKTARLQVLDLKTGQVLGSLHTPKWDRGKPTGITVAASVLDATKQAVYVADTHEHRVLMYELPLPDVDVPVPTEPDFAFGSFGENPVEFIYPTDVAIDTDENGVVTDLYVSEYGGNDRISRFSIDRSGETIKPIYQYQIGVVGEEVDASDFPNALARPQSIALWTTPQGIDELIVTDASHHRVGRFTIEGELVKWFGDPMDTSELAYRFPYGLTILDDGTALIAEFGGNRVRCMNLESGETLWRYGVGGRSTGQLAQPWAVGVNGDQLVILDSGNSRIQICELPKGITRIGAQYARAHGGSNP
jgi:NHL repeat-containing protein